MHIFEHWTLIIAILNLRIFLFQERMKNGNYEDGSIINLVFAAHGCHRISTLSQKLWKQAVINVQVIVALTQTRKFELLLMPCFPMTVRSFTFKTAAVA